MSIEIESRKFRREPRRWQRNANGGGGGGVAVRWIGTKLQFSFQKSRWKGRTCQMKTFPSPLPHCSPNLLLSHSLAPLPRSILFLILSQLTLCSFPNWKVSLPKEITAPPPRLPLVTFTSFHCSHREALPLSSPYTSPLHGTGHCTFLFPLSFSKPLFWFLQNHIMVIPLLKFWQCPCLICHFPPHCHSSSSPQI